MAVREEKTWRKRWASIWSQPSSGLCHGRIGSGLEWRDLASKLGAIFPHSFNFLISINVLSLHHRRHGQHSRCGRRRAGVGGLPELMREFAEFRFCSTASDSWS